MDVEYDVMSLDETSLEGFNQAIDDDVQSVEFSEEMVSEMAVEMGLPELPTEEIVDDAEMRMALYVPDNYLHQIDGCLFVLGIPDNIKDGTISGTPLKTTIFRALDHIGLNISDLQKSNIPSLQKLIHKRDGESWDDFMNFLHDYFAERPELVDFEVLKMFEHAHRAEFEQLFDRTIENKAAVESYYKANPDLKKKPPPKKVAVPPKPTPTTVTSLRKEADTERQRKVDVVGIYVFPPYGLEPQHIKRGPDTIIESWKTCGVDARFLRNNKTWMQIATRDEQLRTMDTPMLGAPDYNIQRHTYAFLREYTNSLIASSQRPWVGGVEGRKTFEATYQAQLDEKKYTIPTLESMVWMHYSVKKREEFVRKTHEDMAAIKKTQLGAEVPLITAGTAENPFTFVFPDPQFNARFRAQYTQFFGTNLSEVIYRNDKNWARDRFYQMFLEQFSDLAFEEQGNKRILDVFVARRIGEPYLPLYLKKNKPNYDPDIKRFYTTIIKDNRSKAKRKFGQPNSVAWLNARVNFDSDLKGFPDIDDSSKTRPILTLANWKQQYEEDRKEVVQEKHPRKLKPAKDDKEPKKKLDVAKKISFKIPKEQTYSVWDLLTMNPQKTVSADRIAQFVRQLSVNNKFGSDHMFKDGKQHLTSKMPTIDTWFDNVYHNIPKMSLFDLDKMSERLNNLVYHMTKFAKGRVELWFPEAIQGRVSDEAAVVMRGAVVLYYWTKYYHTQRAMGEWDLWKNEQAFIKQYIPTLYKHIMNVVKVASPVSKNIVGVEDLTSLLQSTIKRKPTIQVHPKRGQIPLPKPPPKYSTPVKARIKSMLEEVPLHDTPRKTVSFKVTHEAPFEINNQPQRFGDRETFYGSVVEKIYANQKHKDERIDFFKQQHTNYRTQEKDHGNTQMIKRLTQLGRFPDHESGFMNYFGLMSPEALHSVKLQGYDTAKLEYAKSLYGLKLFPLKYGLAVSEENRKGYGDQEFSRYVPTDFSKLKQGLANHYHAEDIPIWENVEQFRGHLQAGLKYRQSLLEHYKTEVGRVTKQHKIPWQRKIKHLVDDIAAFERLGQQTTRKRWTFEDTETTPQKGKPVDILVLEEKSKDEVPPELQTPPRNVTMSRSPFATTGSSPVRYPTMPFWRRDSMSPEYLKGFQIHGSPTKSTVTNISTAVRVRRPLDRAHIVKLKDILQPVGREGELFVKNQQLYGFQYDDWLRQNEVAFPIGQSKGIKRSFGSIKTNKNTRKKEFVFSVTRKTTTAQMYALMKYIQNTLPHISKTQVYIKRKIFDKLSGIHSTTDLQDYIDQQLKSRARLTFKLTW